MARSPNGTQNRLLSIAERDPELAGRLFVAALPAAAAPVQERLAYRMVLDGVGSWDVCIDSGTATVTPHDGDAPAEAELSGVADSENDFVMRTDPLTLARLAAGTSPLRLLLSGRLRIRGNRRRAMLLRQLAGDLTMQEIARAGEPDPDTIYRAMPYAIDSAWTTGQRFCIEYRMQADETGQGGTWFLQVADGTVTVSGESPDQGPPGSILTFSHSTWLRLMRGELDSNVVMRDGLVRLEGAAPPVTLVGRWLERAEGRDEPELERERRQGAIQARRATWGSAPPSNGALAPGQGDPAQAPAGEARQGGMKLLGYDELYALWERQNWRAHEIDFTVDKQHWLATPSYGQADTMWSMSNFYIGEERVAADLAPFVMAAPSGEIEIFLTTQLVDEARHAAFFDRFMAEVMALEPEDIRGRLAEMEQRMLPPWREIFDNHLRGIARRLLERPDDLDLFVEGIVTYHVVIEGVLAMTGQHTILKYVEDHGLYPGFRKGFSLVEQDEHRHIAFGVRFLRDVCEQEPRYRDLIRDKLLELVPTAALVFVPPGIDDPSDFNSYDWHSSEIYGFAYRTLKRRMAVVGVDVPSPEELMPGPIALA